MHCFKQFVVNVLKDNLFWQYCLNPCNSVKYLTTMGKVDFDLSTIWTEGKTNETLATYLVRLSERMAIMRINFNDPQATSVVIDDAKVSLADMVANVGGTFGVFLGLSVVGLFNYLLDLNFNDYIFERLFKY